MSPKSRRVKRIYDAQAPLYDLLLRLTALIEGVDDARDRRRLVQQLDLQSGAQVLVVASGTGLLLPHLRRVLGRHGRIIGLDISREMLKQGRLKARVRNDTLLVQGDAQRLPLPADCFDAVINVGSIHYMADAAVAICEMMRVAKPGAAILISDKSLCPERQTTLRRKVAARLRPRLTRHRPPFDAIPLPKEALQTSWLWNGAFYSLHFTNPQDDTVIS